MRKKIFIIVLLFVLSYPLFANNDVSLYIDGLESMVQEDSGKAKASFNTLVNQFPNSQYHLKASDYLYKLNNKVDNSGIVPFYSNNLATLSYTSFLLLDLFNVDQNSITVGLAGLAGVGLGLGNAYLLSKDQPISSEFYSRIMSNQAVSMGNFLYLQGLAYEYDIFNGNTDLEEKVLLASQLATLNGSLLLSYYGLKDKELQKGKGWFGLQTYAWANYYYWLSTFLFESTSLKNTLALGLGVTDVAYLGSLLLWDQIKWSSSRSGLVSVGGLGGALVGYFATLLLDGMNLDTKTNISIVMGSSLAGKIFTTYLTRNLDSNSSNNDKIAMSDKIMPYPIINGNNEFGIGFNCVI